MYRRPLLYKKCEMHKSLAWVPRMTWRVGKKIGAGFKSISFGCGHILKDTCQGSTLEWGLGRKGFSLDRVVRWDLKNVGWCC